MSPRAVQTLKEADFIAAEDTRVTVKLLKERCIDKPMVSFNKGDFCKTEEEICERIRKGENCALVSDAGMPCISDPGEKLVRCCAENGITVHAVPGPTALASALAISGLSTGRFTFEGFLSVKKTGRREHLLSLQEEKRTMIFYEAPKKLPDTLKDLFKAFGDRKIAIVRELTKPDEEVIRTTLADAAEKYADGSVKGEVVLIIDGFRPPAENDIQRMSDK